MNRRTYLAAAVGLLGASAGCLSEIEPMTQDEIDSTFEQVQTFDDSPVPSQNSGARMVDPEAGVVIYALAGKQGVGLSTIPIEDTDLELD